MSENIPYKITSTDQLPVKVNQRRTTDLCCTIFSTLFTVLLFLILLVIRSPDNLMKISYPNDAAGDICGYEQVNFPYLYYASLTDPSKRLCVAACPKAGDTTLKCKPTPGLSCNKNTNPKYQVNIYDTVAQSTRIGLFCFPSDPTLKDKVIANSGIQQKYNFLGFYDAMVTAGWISIILGLTSFWLLNFFPYKIVPWTIAIGCLLCIIFGIVIMIVADGYPIAKIIVGLIFICIGGLSGYSLWNKDRREAIYICSRMIHASTITHESKNKQTQLGLNLGLLRFWQPLLLIFAFMGILFVFILITVYEILSAWSVGKLVYRPDYPFYQVVGFGSNFLQILIFFQFIWGLSFLKQAFNFIVSGHAVQWYFAPDSHQVEQIFLCDAEIGFDNMDNEPNYRRGIWLLIRYHWGSVLAASFMVLFFLADMAIDFFLPSDIQKPKQPQMIDEDRQFDQSSSGCFDFFNLIRAEALAYINIVNYPFCNAARYCEYLSCQSSFYNYSQTTNRIFRINQYTILIALTLAISLFMMKSQGTATIYGIFFICVISFFVSTFPIAYHGDKAEALLISTYVEQALNQDLQKCPKIVKIATDEDKNDKFKDEKFNGIWNLLTYDGAI